MQRDGRRGRHRRQLEGIWKITEGAMKITAGTMEIRDREGKYDAQFHKRGNL